MVYSPPPLSGGRREKERKKERGRTHEKTTFFLLLSLQFVTTKWHDISLNHVKYIPLGGSSIYMREDQPAVQYCRTNDRRKWVLKYSFYTLYKIKMQRPDLLYLENIFSTLRHTLPNKHHIFIYLVLDTRY